MENENFELRNISYDFENFVIKYYKTITNEMAENFIEDTKRLIIQPKTVNSNKDLQQTFHVMLMIKHLTDYPIRDNSIKELKEQAITMITGGLFNKIISHLEKNLVKIINDLVLTHSIIVYGTAPTYLSGKNYPQNSKLKAEQIVKYETYTFKDLIEKSASSKKKSNKKIVTPTTDQLLEELSDYKNLYEQWKDAQYSVRIEHILKVLKGEELYCEI